jgi:uncharacterized protein YjbJ (UPF0337 family)
MDWNRVEGNWKQVKGQVKEKWGKLTDDELDQMNVVVSSLRAKSRSATASPKIRRRKMSMPGITQ